MPNPVDCEVNVLCQLTNIKTDISRLYDRTDDINDVLLECCSGDGTTPPPPTTGSSSCVEVTNEAELIAAVLVGGCITVVGEIIIHQELKIAKPNTHIFAKVHPTTGQVGKITRPGNGNQEQNVIFITAPGAKLIGLEITANNSLFALVLDVGGNVIAGQQYDRAVYIHPEGPQDASDCTIENCYIHNVTLGIQLMASGAFYADRVKIRNNRIESFSSYGIYLDRCMRNLVIEGNWVWGRKNAELTPNATQGTGETHPVAGNGIWIGNYSQRCIIRFNDVAQCDRHGIELVSAEDSTSDSNSSAIIVGNIVHDLLPAPGMTTIFVSFGLSIHAGANGAIIALNHVRNTSGYGIEIFNDYNSVGARYLVTGNTVRNVISPATWQAFGISINSNIGGLITGNHVENVRPGVDPSLDKEAYGIAIIGGHSAGHDDRPKFVRTTVTNNVLIDAGTVGIMASGIVNLTEATIALTITNNVIHWTKARYHAKDNTVNPISAIIVVFCGKACVVKDNIFYYPEDDPPPAGAYWHFGDGFDLAHGGTVYTGHSSEAPRFTDVLGAPAIQLGGSNLTIKYKDTPPF